MIAKREVWNYPKFVKVWVGKYKNSHNLLHWHYDCELLFVEHGEIDVFCDKHTHRLKGGDALFVDSGEMHYMRARDPETILIVIIFDREIVRPYTGEVRLSSPLLSGRCPIPEFYTKIRDALLSGSPFAGGEAAGLVLTLMSEVFGKEALAQKAMRRGRTAQFMALLEDLGEKYEFYTFSEAAAFMGMSEAYFSRYFRAETGIPFTNYLNYIRIEHAIEELKKGQATATEISSRCGFGTIRNFNRIFKSITGYAPRDLPRGFVLDEKFAYPSDAEFDPTLYDCELLESAEKE